MAPLAPLAPPTTSNVNPSPVPTVPVPAVHVPSQVGLQLGLVSSKSVCSPNQTNHRHHLPTSMIVIIISYPFPSLLLLSDHYYHRNVIFTNIYLLLPSLSQSTSLSSTLCCKAIKIRCVQQIIMLNSNIPSSSSSSSTTSIRMTFVRNLYQPAQVFVVLVSCFLFVFIIIVVLFLVLVVVCFYW